MASSVVPAAVSCGDAVIRAPSVKQKLFAPNRTHLMLSAAPGALKDEMQGSDSGISLHSRDGTKSKSAFQPFSSSGSATARADKNGGGTMAAAGGTTSGLSLPDDIASLPFDMPKLVRRRQLLEQVSVGFCGLGIV